MSSTLQEVMFLASFYYSCGLSTATIEYSSVCVCVSVCVYLAVCLSVFLCACKYDNSKNNESRNLKFKYIVAYEYIYRMISTLGLYSTCSERFKVTG